mmetsp:Transcript_52326/g.86803  ORF Transcript_52326/g.86803 Transcript_52326/m.86803 type:complete len:93 (+) Transcript_52326:1598-1876(+)
MTSHNYVRCSLATCSLSHSFMLHAGMITSSPPTNIRDLKIWYAHFFFSAEYDAVNYATYTRRRDLHEATFLNASFDVAHKAHLFAGMRYSVG